MATDVIRRNLESDQFVWDSSTMSWVKMTQPLINAGSVTISGTVAVSNFPATQPVSAVSLPLPTGAATEATLASVKTAVEIIDNIVSGARALTTEDNSAAIKTAVEIIDNFISGSRGLVTEDNSAAIKTAVEILDNIVSGTSASTKEVRASSSAVTAVADSASNGTLLAANANRLGATIENDSSAVLYLKLGATASSTSYTVRIVQYGYYEIPFGYTGIIDGIWASDPNDGAARITELTA